MFAESGLMRNMILWVLSITIWLMPMETKDNDFPSLEEAQIARSYVPNRNLKIVRRRHEGRNMVGKTTEITEFDPYEEQLKQGLITCQK